MNYKIYSLITLLLLLVVQLMTAQTEVSLNNGRTPAQEAIRVVTPAPIIPATAKAAARGSEEEGLDKDEGKYERPATTGLNGATNLDAINTQLQELASQYAALQLSNEALVSELTKIKGSLQLCCGGGSLGQITKGMDIDEKTAYLLQNAPNPFNQTTQVQYFIPYNVMIANLEIRDLSGKILKTLVLPDRGLAAIDIEEAALESGSYIYTLEVDGQLIDSKIMILTK